MLPFFEDREVALRYAADNENAAPHYNYTADQLDIILGINRSGKGGNGKGNEE